jgi:hypothetical protein
MRRMLSTSPLGSLRAMSQRSLGSRVAAAAEDVLARQKYVTPLDVCVRIGWLAPAHVDSWRQGRTGSLEEALPVSAGKLDELLRQLRSWAADKGLASSEASYVAATRDRRELRFTAAGTAAAEQAWRTSWTSPGLTERQAARVTARQSKAPDLVVIQPAKDFVCAECRATGGDLLIMEDAGPLCLTCADMDHLVFLAAGNAALTRRSQKASRLSAVVVRWQKSRKRYERRGLLVEEPALARAEQECLADEDIRARRRERDAVRRAGQDVEFQARFAAEIAKRYPGCPPDRAEAIAGHAAVRGSGRVGRSAAARAFDSHAIKLAVVASIRHLDTDYDDLLMAGVPREEARERIRAAIDEVLAAWSLPDAYRAGRRLIVTAGSGHGGSGIDFRRTGATSEANNSSDAVNCDCVRFPRCPPMEIKVLPNASWYLPTLSITSSGLPISAEPRARKSS